MAFSAKGDRYMDSQRFISIVRRPFYETQYLKNNPSHSQRADRHRLHRFEYLRKTPLSGLFQSLGYISNQGSFLSNEDQWIESI
jgi:hypothetical protein